MYASHVNLIMASSHVKGHIDDDHHRYKYLLVALDQTPSSTTKPFTHSNFRLQSKTHSSITTMQFFTCALILATAASAVAGPTRGPFKPRQAPGVCPSGTPLCCEADVLGVLDLACDRPPNNPNPTNGTAFQADCASQGKTSTCCTLNLVCGSETKVVVICSDFHRKHLHLSATSTHERVRSH